MNLCLECRPGNMWLTDIVIVTSHFNEDLNWYENSPYQVVICTNSPNHTQYFNNPLVKLDENCRATVNHGREASAYLRFIVKYYDCLPEYMAFLHGHETAWHHNYPGTLFEAIKHAKKEEYDHINLNLQFHIDYLKPGFYYWDSMREVWPIHFESVVGVPVPDSVSSMAICAQFIVKRDCILRYPKEQWEKWLALLQDPGLWNNHIHFQNMAWVFEYGWAVLFGEDWECSSENYYKNRFVHATNEGINV